jgi:hypothetical protein
MSSESHYCEWCGKTSGECIALGGDDKDHAKAKAFNQVLAEREELMKRLAESNPVDRDEK